MNKFVISIFAIALGINAKAQTIGNSPYATYGIGDQKYDNTVETKSMGGISTAYISDFNNHFNFQNPAANQNLELTSIKFQGTNENQFLKSDYNNAKFTKHSTYISNISLAFPISKHLKFGVGFQPYSTKDYNISQEITMADGTMGTQKFYGDGGVNLLQAGLGLSLSPSFAIGVSSNLYFGNTYDIEETTYQNSTLINSVENKTQVHNFNFTIGSIYQKKFKNNRKFTLGATYTFGNTSDFETTYTNSSYFLTGTQKNYQTTTSETKKNITNNIPQEYSFGIGFGHDTKWFISSQFNYKNGVNSTDFNQGFEYQDAYKIALGGWFLPNFNNFRNYLSRVTYRYGAFYEKGNLKINQTDIDRYGVAFGASFPFSKNNINRQNTLDLGIEFGQRGTLDNNLIKENFLNFTIGLNFANKWFEKQYYD